MSTLCEPSEHYSDFLFKNHSFKEELSVFIRNSNPKSIPVLVFTKVSSNFDLGNFIFYLKGDLGEFSIPFNHTFVSINDLWRFLEAIVLIKEPLILNLFYKGIETFVYTEVSNENFIRLLVANTEELYKKERARRILKYSYSNSKVVFDVIIKRKIFIKQFYDELYKLFKNFEPIAYFEPPFINFDTWIKDSLILRKYLRVRKSNIRRCR